jgi:hypothetical protein
MGQARRPTCPHCGAFLILALPPGGKGQRMFRCFECDGVDPLKTDQATGWLNGELQRRNERYLVGTIAPLPRDSLCAGPIAIGSAMRGKQLEFHSDSVKADVCLGVVIAGVSTLVGVGLIIAFA